MNELPETIEVQMFGRTVVFRLVHKGEVLLTYSDPSNQMELVVKMDDNQRIPTTWNK